MAQPYPIPRQTRQTDVFVGNGGAVYSGFNFKIFDTADVEVWSKASGDNTFSKQTVNVAKAANLPLDDFSVTFTASQPSSTQIVVRSARIAERTAGVDNGTRIDMTALEKELSKQATVLEEVRRDIDRAFISDFGSPRLTIASNMPDGAVLMKDGNAVIAGPNIQAIADEFSALVAAFVPVAFVDRSAVHHAIINPLISEIYVAFYNLPDANPRGGGWYKRVSSQGSWPYECSVTDLLGGIWVLDEVRPNVFQFGAKGNLTTDDTGAFRAASAYMSLRGGGTIDVPPAGAAYRLACFEGPIYLPNGVVFEGDKAHNYEGTQGTIAQWSQFGSWVKPESLIYNCFQGVGHGCGVKGLRFIHDQTIPQDGVAYVPKQFAYCISMRVSHCFVDDVTLVNAFNGIEIALDSVSSGGGSCRFTNLDLSGFGTLFRTSMINDTIYVRNIKARPLFYNVHDQIRLYNYLHVLFWDCGYTDNPQISAVEVLQYKALRFRDETCQGVTHSMWNFFLTDCSFNLTQAAMEVENATTHVSGWCSNTLAQQGNAFGYTYNTTIFDLRSANVDITFEGLRVPDAGGIVMQLGAGARVGIENLSVEQYSTVTGNQSAFELASGATLELGRYRIKKPIGAGLRFAGAGADAGVISVCAGSKDPFSRLLEMSTTGNGSFQDVSTDIATRPRRSGVHQLRLTGELYVATAQAAGAAQIRIANFPLVNVVGIVASAAGVFKQFDSQWYDLEETVIAADSILGRIQILATAGVVLQNGGSLSVQYR